jgi:hypothetical protein
MNFTGRSAKDELKPSHPMQRVLYKTEYSKSRKFFRIPAEFSNPDLSY